MTKEKQLNFSPFGNWLVLPDPTTRKTESGIILDDDTAKKMATNILKVLAAGPIVLTNCLLYYGKWKIN